MLTPVEFMNRYRKLKVPVADFCTDSYPYFWVQLRKYHLNRDNGDEAARRGTVTPDSENHKWLRSNEQRVRNAGMGKGAPEDYELALEWAVRSKMISNVTPSKLQLHCDQHLGIDCSGFVMNYLIACGKSKPTNEMARNNTVRSGAYLHYAKWNSVNDHTQIMMGDLLVWMKDDNSVKEPPGWHVALVESYRPVPESTKRGTLHVVEACDVGTMQQPCESEYTVEDNIPKGVNGAPVMILAIRRTRPQLSGAGQHRVSIRRI